MVSFMLTVTHSCSISLLSSNSCNYKVKGRSTAILIQALHSKVRIMIMNYEQDGNHLMVTITVNPLEVTMVTVSVLKVARICSLTRRMDLSQSQSWKYGK